MPQDTM